MNNAPEEKIIDNWKEFCSFCNEMQGYTSGSTDTWIFRGHRNVCWKLMYSLHREIKERKIDPSKIYEIEKQLLDKFLQKWFPRMGMGSYIRNSLLFQILSIMQQYGIRTRMLDWTQSWFVAAYFATEEKEANGNDKDAAIWCINETQIEKCFRKLCKEYDIRKKYCLDRMIKPCLNITDERNCPVRQICNNKTQCNAIFFKDISSSSTDVRMIIQASIFTYCHNPLADYKESITKILADDTYKYCKKIIIPKSSNGIFREELEKRLKSADEILFPCISQKENQGILDSVMSEYQNKK